MAVGMLLSISVCVVAVLGEESCDPPTRSAALLQSSAHRNCKSTAEPYVVSPAAMFGPGPMGRMAQRMGPHQMRPPMGPPGMQNYPGQPNNFNLEHSQARGESSYGTSGGGEVTPCQNSNAWTPDYDFAGYCNTWSLAVPLTKETCDVEGCRYSHSYCYCETEAGCTAVGATWSLGRIKTCSVLENLFGLQVNITACRLCFVDFLTPLALFLWNTSFQMTTFRMIHNISQCCLAAVLLLKKLKVKQKQMHILPIILIL